MTLQQIRYFVTLSKTLSFTKTAQVHFVSQTAITQQIKLLEQELDVKLFSRTNRSVQLTLAGRHFLEQAVKILDLLAMSSKQLKDINWKEEHPLTVGLAGTDSSFIHSLLGDLHEEHPEIQLQFLYSGYEKTLRDIINLHTDLGIMIEMYPVSEPGLQKLCISRQQQYVVVNNKSRLAQHHLLTRSQLEGETFFTAKVSKESLSIMYTHFLQAGCRSVHIHTENTLDAVFLQTAFSQGFTILAESAVKWIPPDLNLSIIPLSGETIPLCLFWNERNTSPALELVLSVLRNTQM